jgi:hypothetical protein
MTGSQLNYACITCGITGPYQNEKKYTHEFFHMPILAFPAVDIPFSGVSLNIA